MEYLHEDIRYDHPFLSMRIFEVIRHKDFLNQWHYHKEIELLLILKGHLEVFIQDERYHLQQGDVLLIGSGQPHRDRSFAGKDLEYIVFQVDLNQYMEQSTMPYYAIFSEAVVPLSELNYILREQKHVQEQIAQCVLDIHNEWQERKEAYEIAVSMQIKKIFLLLMRNDSRQLLDFQDSSDLLRLKPVLDYIEQNTGEPIDVATASQMANVSYHYFVKLFRKTMGLSFLEYVNYKKIKRAERILLTKNISIAQVGEEIGMTNMAHFYKMFKKYNQCSPNEYRKKLQTWISEKDWIDNQAKPPALSGTEEPLPEPELEPAFEKPHTPAPRKPKPPAVPTKDELYNCFGSHS